GQKYFSAYISFDPASRRGAPALRRRFLPSAHSNHLPARHSFLAKAGAILAILFDKIYQKNKRQAKLAKF
ncbi:MAG: hypothetical protein AAB952_00980, partial [Patescibacteria group bacterium]